MGFNSGFKGLKINVKDIECEDVARILVNSYTKYLWELVNRVRSFRVS